MKMLTGASRVLPISLQALIPLVNRRHLFFYHWGFKRENDDKALAVFRNIVEKASSLHSLQPQAVYSFYACSAEGENLSVYAQSRSQEKLAQFSFPRQQAGKKQCLTDYFQQLELGSRSLIAFQAVTLGSHAADYEQTLFSENRYQDYLFYCGWHMVLVEALAQFTFQRIQQEARVWTNSPKAMRFSWGYPCCPDLTQQGRLLNLVGAERIGISETETHQLIPIHSTAAFISFDRKARYFTVPGSTQKTSIKTMSYSHLSRNDGSRRCE